MTRAILIFLIGMPAIASEPLLACRVMEAAEQRLECYDSTLDALYPVTTQPDSVPPALPSPMAAESNKSAVKPILPVSEPVAKEVAPVASESADDFGQPILTERTQREAISTVQDLSRSSYKKLTITLKNQQVWQQLDTLRMNLHIGDEISIRTARLNSYKLSKSSGGRSIRVKRIR